MTRAEIVTWWCLKVLQTIVEWERFEERRIGLGLSQTQRERVNTKPLSTRIGVEFLT